MDIRIHGLSGALMRRFEKIAGSRTRQREIVAILIEDYVQAEDQRRAEEVDGNKASDTGGEK